MRRRAKTPFMIQNATDFHYTQASESSYQEMQQMQQEIDRLKKELERLNQPVPKVCPSCNTAGSVIEGKVEIGLGDKKGTYATGYVTYCEECGRKFRFEWFD